MREREREYVYERVRVWERDCTCDKEYVCVYVCMSERGGRRRKYNAYV